MKVRVWDKTITFGFVLISAVGRIMCFSLAELLIAERGFVCVWERERERALAWSEYGAFIWAQGRWKGWVHRQDVPLVIPVSALVWSVADFGLVFRLTVVHIGLFSALMSGRRTSCGIEHLQPRPRSEPSPLPFEHNYSTQINYCYYMVVLCFYQMCSLSGCWSHRVFPLIFPQWWDFFFLSVLCFVTA